MPCQIKLSPADTSREPAFYDHLDYERLVTAAAALDPGFLVLVLLAGEAGLRRGEVMGLNLSDVDFVNTRLTVRRSVWVSRGNQVVDEPKGMKVLPIALTPRLLEALRAVRHLRGERVLYVDDGSELTPKYIRNWIEKIEKKANMPVTGRLHVLRHTFASHAAMRSAGQVAETSSERASAGRHSKRTYANVEGWPHCFPWCSYSTEHGLTSRRLASRPLQRAHLVTIPSMFMAPPSIASRRRSPIGRRRCR
jgi:integrase